MDYSYREFRNGAIFLLAMADFWKAHTDKCGMLNEPAYREAFFDMLARKAAQNAVWKAGYNFFSGGLHGFPTD